jgi:hypothetical protein
MIVATYLSVTLSLKKTGGGKEKGKKIHHT